MRKILALFVLLVAQPVAAQQVVPIQSGEHDGFSRLVLQIDPEVTWQLDTGRGQAALRFPGQSLRFSTERVFDLIGKNRIADVSAATSDSGSALELALNCDCAVESFAYIGRYIVLDVFDGPALPPEITAQTADAWRPDPLPFIQPSAAPARFTASVMTDAPRQPVLLPDPPPKPENASLATPSPPDRAAEAIVSAESAAAGMVQQVEDMTSIARGEMNDTVNARDNPALQARIDEAQGHLLAQLTRAADQGLITFVPAPVPEQAEVTETVEIAPEVAVEAAPPDPALMQQLSARSAYAQSTEDALTEIVNQFAMPQCLDDALFSMEGWAGAQGFSAQLADLRSRRVGEFDVMDPAVTEAIIRLYLRYGLGVEARLILAESTEEVENAGIYRDMAYLLEGEPEGVTGPVLKGVGCGGDHELWYLTTGQGNSEVLEPLSITEAFARYPIEVRTLIGPPLAEAFIARGQVDAGHVVLEIVRRADGEITNAQRMAEARVLEAHDDSSGAEAIYKALAETNDELAPDALIAYANGLIMAGKPVPPTLLLDLEAAAFLHRDTAKANALRLWEIRVRAKVEGAGRALGQITETLAERPELAEELRALTADILQQARAADSGDYAYAQMVLQHAGLLDRSALGDAARLQIASEMANIGLPETALELLAPNLNRATTEANLLAATAHLQMFKPDLALARIADDASLAAFKLRVQANLQREDYAAVAELLAQDNAREISVNDFALRAGDWARIKDAGALGTMAAYMAQGNGGSAVAVSAVLTPMIADEQPSLKAARALLADNQSSRDFLQEVLAESAPVAP